MAPLNDEDEERESRRTGCLAGIVIVAGALLVVVCFLGLESGALYVVDKLVVWDSTWHVGNVIGEASSGFVITTRRIFVGMIFIALMTVFAGLLGIVGSNTRHKGVVCSYVVFAFIFTVLTLAGSAEIFLRKQVVQPLIERQVPDLCNATTYMRLAAHIPCKFAAAYSPAEKGFCGPICRIRTRNFKQLHGCTVMERLCKQFYYKEVGSDASECANLVVDEDNDLYMTSTTRSNCKDFCDKDIRCTRYAYSAPTADHSNPQVCILGQAVGANHPPPTWAKLVPSDVKEYLKGPAQCFQRTEPVVLAKFKLHSTRLAACSLLLGIILLVSTIASCCLMYNVNIKRWDRPAAHELGCMMCCPCLPSSEDDHRKFNEPQLSDLDSDYDEENSDGKP